MPTLTLTFDSADALGLSAAELLQWALSGDAQRRLEPLLISRGFDVRRTIHLSRLASGQGILLEQ